MAMQPMTPWTWVQSQFKTLRYPDEDCTGKTFIVTGANVGLGLEAARHFVRLGAAKVILACRNVDKAEDAKRDIESSTHRTGVVEVWQLDLASFESVKQFAARAAAELDRVDALVNNASVMGLNFATAEGCEMQTTVNVTSTLLLIVMLLPTLRRSGTKFNVTPCVTVVSSDAAFLARFPEAKADNAMQALSTKWDVDRYSTTKLVQLLMVRKLAAAADSSGKGHLTMNAVNPGLCNTQLYRSWPFPLSLMMRLMMPLLGRTPEMGSRPLTAAALTGDETHQRFLTDYAVTHPWPSSTEGDKGERLAKKVWDELLEILEGIEPGVTGNI